MEEENNGTINLDSMDDGQLGLGSYHNIAMNLEDSSSVLTFNQLIRLTRGRPLSGRRYRRRFVRTNEPQSHPLELIGANSSQTRENNVSPGEGLTGITKICENGNGFAEDETNGNVNERSFFYCNICLDLAKDPVVTCCGHLFCWTCLYRWLHSKECPVCKGGVTEKSVTPIYGRGNILSKPDPNSSQEIPSRPQARRVENERQTIQQDRSEDFLEPIDNSLSSSTEDLFLGSSTIHLL